MPAEDEEFLSLGGGNGSEAEPAAGGGTADDSEEESDSDEEGEEEEEGEQDDAAPDSGEEDDDGTFDFDSIAERGAHAAEVAAQRRRLHKEHELSLDVGLSDSNLYLMPGLSRQQRAFDTSAAPGVSRLDAADFLRGGEPAAPSLPRRIGREVRGVAPRPVDDKNLRKREAKVEREARLDKWFGLRRRKLTPELEAELKAIKLRANFDPKRFYKAHDSKELPKYFTIASEVGGGLAAVGLHTRTQDVHAHSGRSFLDEVLRNEQAQEWTRKRQIEVEQRGQGGFTSGHGKSRSKKAAATGTHRGGGWKKQKRG